eukprot:6237787-Pyramimonas_sp.AAC.1
MVAMVEQTKRIKADHAQKRKVDNVVSPIVLRMSVCMFSETAKKGGDCLTILTGDAAEWRLLVTP